MNELETKLNCILGDIGGQIGDLIRCMVDAEVASHMARITVLLSVLNGTACVDITQLPGPQPSEASPAA